MLFPVLCKKGEMQLYCSAKKQKNKTRQWPPIKITAKSLCGLKHLLPVSFVFNVLTPVASIYNLRDINIHIDVSGIFTFSARLPLSQWRGITATISKLRYTQRKNKHQITESFARLTFFLHKHGMNLQPNLGLPRLLFAVSSA